MGVEVTPRREQPAEKEVRAPMPPIRFVAAARQAEREQDAPRPVSEAPLYADEPRYALKVSCSLWTKLVGDKVEITSTVTSVTTRPDIVLVAAGECLPLRDNSVDVIEATYKAVKRATTATMGFHTRQQLLVFGTAYDMDVAVYWAESMLRELGRHQTVTSVQQSESKSRIEEAAKRAYSRCQSPTVDGRTMLGPREFHKTMFEKSCQRHARAAPLAGLLRPASPVAHAGTRQSDSDSELDEMLDDEQEIMMETGGGGPPPPDE